jgi:putative membrane protein
MTSEPRQPRAFAPDDPALVIDPVEPAQPRLGPEEAPAPADAGIARPTLADIGSSGLRWGLLLASALAGAALLGLIAWFSGLVSEALARADWVATATLALLLVAAFAAAMIVLREIAGFLRLRRLGKLKRDVAAALQARDARDERRAAQRLVALYAGRPEAAWGRSRFQEHARDVHDPGALLTLAEREILLPLDRDGRSMITASAKRVAAVTALSPMLLIAVGFVLVENLRLLRALATLYGGRPGLLGVLRLARMVLGHMLATGGIALTDDLLGQFLGQDLLRRLSRRLGEGAINGALTARIGVTAIEVIRPLPFLSGKAPRIRDVLSEALKPLLQKSSSDK